MTPVIVPCNRGDDQGVGLPPGRYVDMVIAQQRMGLPQLSIDFPQGLHEGVILAVSLGRIFVFFS